MEMRPGARLLSMAIGCMVLLHGGHVSGMRRNYTVGDSLGWYSKLDNPNIDYLSWVSGKSFILGDFLTFNTDTNHSVVQTYNQTTYRQCNIADAEEEDTTIWATNGPGLSIEPISVVVPLTKEGMNYFFSSLYEGDQCMHGQRFEIDVAHGVGSPLVEAAAPSPDDGGAVPDTVVPYDFSHPKKLPPAIVVSDGDKIVFASLGRLFAATLWLSYFIFM
ncbi:early nodulin-like protein 18 [Wolffia australiana]